MIKKMRSEGDSGQSVHQLCYFALSPSADTSLSKEGNESIETSFGQSLKPTSVASLPQSQATASTTRYCSPEDLGGKGTVMAGYFIHFS